MLKYLIILLFVATLLPAQSFEYDFGAKVEVGAISNSARESGGNEVSLGDFLFNPRLALRYPTNIECVSGLFIKADYVPDMCLLNFADEDKVNMHNQNWLRADGYVSRPDLLFDINILFTCDMHLRAGAFMTSGLEPLSKSSYYLLTPAPMFLTQHFDKGFEIALTKDWLKLKASVVDGDWTVGQVSVFTPSDSRANSTPTVAGMAEIDVLSWTSDKSLIFGVTGNYGDIGSYPGQKRCTDNYIFYTGSSTELFGAELSSRVGYYIAVRNPKGDGSGVHVDQIDTDGYTLELSYSKIETGQGKIGVHGNYWVMHNEGGVDGEIWPYACSKMTGYGVVVRWTEMLNVDILYSEFGYSHITADEEVIYGESEFDIYVISTGINF